jgi:hypothetical protein
MKQNEENSQKAQKLTQEELENVNGGSGVDNANGSEPEKLEIIRNGILKRL